MVSISRRTLLVAAGVGVCAPALIGHARAATNLKVSTSFSNDPKFSTARIWYDLFVPRLKEATDGQVTTSFFPDNQLGQEADVVNQVKAGVVDISLTGTPIYANLVPEFGVFDMGYVFQDYDHLRRASNTPAVKALSELLVQKAGTHFPSWGRNLGARNFLTKFAFSDPAGLANKKIRCLPSRVVTETVQLMGAAATPMAFGEVYTALQAGVIDGMEHDAATILSGNFFETAKNFTLTRHIYTPFGAFVSDKTVKRLPPAQREGLFKAIAAATDDHYARAAGVEADAISQLRAKGVTVAECDRAAFRERVSPMWGRFLERTPEARPVFEAVQRAEKA